MNKVKITEPTQGVIELKLSRPSKLNAIDFEIMEELTGILHSLQSSKELRAIILVGEGEKAFCSGGDIEVFKSIKTRDEAYVMLSKIGEVLYQLMIFPLPTFAFLNGLALGGGCEIATACDFRIAKQGIKVGFIQGKLSITTGWGGATLLHEKLTYDNAMSLLFSAKTISAEKAKELGFITEIISEHAFIQKAYEFMDQTLVNNSSVLRSYKAIKVDQWIKSNLYSRMMSEINGCAELWASDDHHLAVEKFLSRNKN